ncbi:MAG: sigma-70 family RNA polymerase sigma factor [Dysgonamonadaceae bacterium]|jgi:RNA polymerase sigma-70 factor (ECF subfamily)|nr:sigma-70 family RNA polymerase sigma factor [Dysgonamonadaceae bacterium]
MDSEKSLLTGLKHGDRKVFAIVWEKYNGSLYGFAFHYLQNRAWAEDCVQWLFLKLWEKRTAINEDGHLRKYLFTSMKNHLLNELRDHARDYAEVNEAMTNDLADAPDAEPVYEEHVLKALRKAIAQLSPQRRRICEMKIDDELLNAEIARRLTLSENTVKFQYNQIIKELRKNMMSSR